MPGYRKADLSSNLANLECNVWIADGSLASKSKRAASQSRDFFSRKGQVWIRIFPDKPVSKKPAETRMGTGKGAPEYWVARVKPGRILFEVANVTREEAQEALRQAAGKLPLRTKFVVKSGDCLNMAKQKKQENSVDCRNGSCRGADWQKKFLHCVTSLRFSVNWKDRIF